MRIARNMQITVIYCSKNPNDRASHGNNPPTVRDTDRCQHLCWQLFHHGFRSGATPPLLSPVARLSGAR